MNYLAFFERATGRSPFPYQARLGEAAWPVVLDVPTGLGKTAAVLVAWLYKRLRGDAEAGARLVYCLPMRVLVQQTTEQAELFCKQAAEAFTAAGVKQPTVHILMGGEVDATWESEPEHSAILVGTQDMLLSRALNRGYAMSRYKWPVHYALLNNDCTWVFDETQMLGVGIETSAQLQALRARLGTAGTTRSVWMSATLGRAQLRTVDHPEPTAGYSTCRLEVEDLQSPLVRRRVEARKALARLDVQLDKASQKQGYIERLADRVLQLHAERGGLTLVVVNQVERAQALYARVRAGASRTDDNTALVHSRFRPPDRAAHERVLLASTAERIVVATQAVEAGVDVSARTLITELAPWPALVQRFGRCNRYGEASEQARVYWVDVDAADRAAELSLPYDAAELDVARGLLQRLDGNGNGDAGPRSLRELPYEPPEVVRPVLRKRDVLDLFDTTPDLSGYDLDVSRFVRDGDDNDVQFFWREFDGDVNGAKLSAPTREELCRVSVAGASEFLKGLQRQKQAARGKDWNSATRLRAFLWNALDRRWVPVGKPRPGQVLLLHCSAGGYDPKRGWTGDPKVVVGMLGGEAASAARPASDEALEADPRTHTGRWVRLQDHLGHVRDEARALALATDQQALAEVLATAGLWHDVGKAHPEFQDRLIKPVEGGALAPPGEGPWAKSAHRLEYRGGRRYFRHELASALAWLAAGEGETPREQDLVAYLVAAHHGKVRLSIRSLPDEQGPSDRPYARGVWDGDVLPPVDLPDGRRLGALTLDLGVVAIGEGGWLERMLSLRDAVDLGPFRLAYLETLLRVADWRASEKEQWGGYDA